MLYDFHDRMDCCYDTASKPVSTTAFMGLLMKPWLAEQPRYLEAPAMHAVTKRPLMPAPLSLPLRMVPGKLHGMILSRLLNRVFQAQLKEGELDFLEGRVVHIRVRDAGLQYALTLEQGRLVEAGKRPADLSISGSVYDYLLLIAGREDPDTLFFQRYLVMDGDTSLGVHLKNMLAGIDPAELPIPKEVYGMVEQGLRLYERVVRFGSGKA
ncbi:MAG: SCP2 sterol-binding domain-containing protein [Candidatus Thiodiazotropha sp.]